MPAWESDSMHAVSRTRYRGSSAEPCRATPLIGGTIEA